MKKYVRPLAIIIMLCMLLAACGSGGNTPTGTPAAQAPAAQAPAATPAAPAAPADTGPDISEFVNLSMYLIGQEAPDYSTMLTEFNKKLKAEINAEVEISWLSRGNYQELYTMLLASGEPVDAIFAGTWTSFYQEAAKGAYFDITDLAPVYMPKTYAEWTDEIRDQVTINGRIYGIPNLFFEYNVMGYIIRGDIADEVGFTKEVRSIDDYGEFLALIAEQRPDIEGSAFASNVDGLISYFARENGFNYFPAWPPITMDIRSGEMISILHHPGMLDFFKKMQEWNNAGYWSKSVLSDTSQNHYQEGRSASWMHNASSWVLQSIARPDVVHRWTPSAPYSTRHRAMQDGQAIPASSKNPERALMMYEAIFQEPNGEYWKMLAYGVEGTHYNITSEGYLNPLNTDLWVPTEYCDWGLQRQEWKIPVMGQPANRDEMFDYLASMGELNPYAIFFGDFEPVRNERAAVVEVYNQYAYPLAYGFVEDVEAGYAEMLAQMEVAGIQVLLDEMHRQLDAYKVRQGIS